MSMILKTAGAVCLLSAGSLTGICLAQRLKLRSQFLLEMKTSLSYLKKEMTFHRTPLCEALMEAAKRTGDDTGDLFYRAVAKLESNESDSFAEIWEGIVRESKWKSLLSKEEYELLRHLRDALCNADTVMQKELIEKYESAFEHFGQNAHQQYMEKGALYRKLSIAASVFLTLLLI